MVKFYKLGYKHGREYFDPDDEESVEMVEIQEQSIGHNATIFHEAFEYCKLSLDSTLRLLIEEEITGMDIDRTFYPEEHAWLQKNFRDRWLNGCADSIHDMMFP